MHAFSILHYKVRLWMAQGQGDSCGCPAHSMTGWIKVNFWGRVLEGALYLGI